MSLTRIIKMPGYISVLIVVLFFPGNLSGQASIPLRLVFTLPEPEIPLHALIDASATIINDSNDAYTLNLGIDKSQAFALTVNTPRGTVLHLSKPVTEGLHSPGIIHIAPKSSYRLDLVLNQWLNFEARGIYHIVLSINAPVNDGKSGQFKAEASGHVNVSPANDNYLKHQCEDLLHSISSTSNYEVAINAATSLSAINDPIAVHYLTRAAEAKPPLAYILISGLEKLGTSEAIGDLLYLAASKDIDTSVLAKRSLKEIEFSAKNSAIRARIRAGLSRLSGTG